jgi:DNA recombination protein Rad52
MFTDEQKAMLSAKLDKSNVKSRKQGGTNVSYIEGWHAIAEANRIFGYDGWDRELRSLVELGQPVEVNGKWRVGYRATVRITVFADGQEIIRDGSGFGQGIDRDVQQAHESGLKEAETDAMKRALMTFGNPFGLALYDKSQSNVEGQNEPPKNQQNTQNNNQSKIDYTIHANTEDEFVSGFEHRLNQMPTVEGVTHLCKVHTNSINTLKANNPDRATALKNMVDRKRNELAQKP